MQYSQKRTIQLANFDIKIYLILTFVKTITVLQLDKDSKYCRNISNTRNCN